MVNCRKDFFIFNVLIFFIFGISACQDQLETPDVTPTFEQTPVITSMPTLEVPTPEELPPADTLVVCMGQEPSTLYLYGDGSMAARNIQQAIYDGPYDFLSFEYQPVILEKLPHLEDGDANIEVVTVSEGDLVVGENNSLVTLESGIMIRPHGCLEGDCFVEYTGGSIEMDQMVVTFNLLPNLKWNDGEPLTASDSVYAYTVASHRDTLTSKFITNRTTSYEALDDDTIQWRGIPGFLDSTYYLNFFGPLPEHIYGEYSPLELRQMDFSPQMLVGWGPYILEQWALGDSITMRKNPNYHRANEGLPLFETLVYRFTGTNVNDNLAALLTGECDILDQTTLLDESYEVLLELEDAGKIDAVFMPGNYWEHIDFGIHPVPYDDGYAMSEGDRPDFFGDVHTRQAIAMCLDRQTVVDTVLFGKANVLPSYLNENHPLFNPLVDTYPFDPGEGIILLEEVGWKDLDGDGIREAHNVVGIDEGTPFSFRYWTTSAPERIQVSELFKQNLLSCGIDVVLEYFSFDEFFDYSADGPIAGRDFDLVQFAYNSSVEPACDQWMSNRIPGDTNLEVGDIPWMKDALGDSFSPDNLAFINWDIWNNAAYVNPIYDDICANALNTLPGEESFEENHYQAQEIIINDLPVIPLYWRNEVGASRPDLCGYALNQNAMSELWNVESIGYGTLCD
ncbi:MAG: peptide ABC transporter substrate-binding protein [Anaerolineales bacterium]|jgi:peptide/nickel transport system substrate-binding protein